MPQLKPPSPDQAVNEVFGWIELPRLVLHSPDLMCAPRGSGSRVIVLPGFGASDSSTFVLRSYLSYLGYRVGGWSLGFNRGDPIDAVRMVTRRLESESNRSNAQIALVGWSLGGYIAREVAREAPDYISQVITLGSPVVGGPKYTLVAGAFERRGDRLDDIEKLVAQREAVPIRVPVTAIYSKRDGVVSWQACIDRRSPHVDHIEVRTTHLGLGFSPEVYRHIASKLARRLLHKNQFFEEGVVGVSPTH